MDTRRKINSTLIYCTFRPYEDLGGVGMGNRMPTRQKSMIDLRDPIVPALWPDHPRNRHLQGNKQYPPPHLASSLAPPSLPHQSIHPNMQSRGPSSMHHTAAGSNMFQGGHNHPPTKHHPAERQRLSAMGRSSTEHDIKVRSRRSMAVGPFEDLPPHIRQHMVSFFHFWASCFHRDKFDLPFIFS